MQTWKEHSCRGSGRPPGRGLNLGGGSHGTCSGPIPSTLGCAAVAMFPGYGTLSPFRGWDTGKPTESLSWYADYNLTKHDRELGLHMATLGNLIMAVAAIYIMLAAQSGFEWFTNSPVHLTDFRPAHQPTWDLADEYVPGFCFPGTGISGAPTTRPFPFCLPNRISG